MQTIWNGPALLAQNQALTDAYLLRSRWIMLSDTPNVVQRVRLPVTTTAVQLWSPEQSCWYTAGVPGLVALPGPILPPAQGTILDDDAFQAGGVILPGQWTVYVLPDPSLQNELQMVSLAASPLVLVTVLVEA